IARFSPLYHAVDMLRAFTLGILDWSILGHVAFLVGMVLVGMTIASRRVEKLLLS
ncbi:MAG: ABC transporter, partial [Acidimicrobiia bacterium]|nr:ABC transporter [Acidimicrobiia bacterium]